MPRAFQGTFTQPAPATKGVRGVLAKLGLGVAPGAAEQAARDAVAQRDAEQVIRQATWTRAVSVLVANPKGGTGKTPVSVLLGGVLGAVRGGSVVVVEVSDAPGTLTFRSEGDPRRGLGELVRDLPNVRTVGQLAGYTAPQTSFASVIGSTSRRAPLTHEAVTGLAHVLDEFYAVRVMDSGNHPTSGAFRAAVETADALVIPVVNAEDSHLAALALLDELRAAGGNAATLADRSVMLRLTDGRAENAQATARVEQRLKGSGPGAILAVPHDAHIAERGPLTLDLLAPNTRAAFTIAAATVVTALLATVP
jgi:MinD-like ATPase involved in chromosome partitioning or flagellar assembly